MLTPSSDMGWLARFDPGYYLFYEQLPVNLPDSLDNGSSILDTDITVTLWNWWKEVLAISILTSVLVHFAMVRLFYSKAIPSLPSLPLLSGESCSNQESVEEVQDEKEDVITVPPNKPFEYESRYCTDFEQVACLGKGGFGVVYQARNRLDVCDYAIKRITLHNSQRSREKVGREVKALAKLEHPGIVRYYQAWFESPPLGWQEQKDAAASCDSHESYTPTPGVITFTEHSPELASNVSFSTHEMNPLKQFDDQILDGGDREEDWSWGKNDTWTDDGSYLFGSGSMMEQQKGHIDSSIGFMPHKNGDSLDIQEESGSFSLDMASYDSRLTVHTAVNDDSFEIEFKESDSEGSCSLRRRHKNTDVPFSRYANRDASCDIVFEDSGCALRNSNETGLDFAIDITGTSNALSSRSTKDIKPSSTIQSVSRATRPNSLDVIDENVDRSVCPPTQSLSKLYLYIQMQMCRKESLKDWLASNTLNRSPQQSLDIFDQIVSAVDYVHGCGMMHRDLKPSNIFFSLDGIVKVGDFGLATEERGTEGGPMTPLVQLSAGGKHTNRVGTKLYMSPEQMAGKQYTNKVDIYALGLIFFELRFPFATMMERGRTMQDVKMLKFPSRFSRELPEECTFVRGLLSHVAAERPTTTELLEHPLLAEVHNERIVSNTRIRTNSRNRTISSTSSNSTSNSL